MADEPDSLILGLLREMRDDLGGVNSRLDRMATKDDLAELQADFKSDMHSLRADVAADFIETRKELAEKITGLRRAVIEYHTTTIGHGVLISELEGRLRRVEQHLNLDASDTH